jgi:hypothetical protein
MPEIQRINGYELLALPPNKINSSVEVNEFRADLSDGFRMQAMYGNAAGTRMWNLGFNAMRNKATPDVTDGDLGLSAARYLWDLFIRTKNSGTPFVVRDPLYNQYYLAEFSDRILSFEQIFTTLFSTGLNLKQVRLRGVTVFDPSVYAEVSRYFQTPITGATDNATLPGDAWNNETGGDDFASVGATYQTNEHNGNAIVRLDTTGGTDNLATVSGDSEVFYEAFLLMKVRETTFAEHSGIISNADAESGSPALLGNAGTTKFFNLGLGAGYEYRMNGIQYAESNQQAPMNQWGVVHIRREQGWTMPNGIVIGQDRPGDFPERGANIDIELIVFASDLLPVSVGYEITSHMVNNL